MTTPGAAEAGIPARALAAAAYEIAYPRVAVARDFDRAERVLLAVAASGWVLVPKETS